MTRNGVIPTCVVVVVTLLQQTVTKQQDMLAMLEEERVDKEASKYLPNGSALAMGLRGVEGPSLIELIFAPTADANPYPAPRAGSLFESEMGGGMGGGSSVADVERVLKDLEAAQEEVVTLMAQTAEMKADKQDLLGRLDAVVMALQEHQKAVRFYEEQAHQENLPVFQLPTITVSLEPSGLAGEGSGGGGNGGATIRGDEAQLQEVANTTIHSLKRLIEEKNRIIERYERKLADARLLSRKESAVGKAEIDRLTEKLFRKNEDAISQLKHAVVSLGRSELTESGAHLSKRLMEQVRSKGLDGWG